MSLQEREHSSFVIQPATAEEAAKLLQSLEGEAAIVAGGTLLRTHWEAGTAAIPRYMIDLGGLPGITGITNSDSGLMIGAMTPLSVCRASSLIQNAFPLLTEACRSIAAPSIRNLATLGGNIVSAIGDAIPALLVYEAVLCWHDGMQEQRELLADWLRQPRKGRILLRVELPFSYTEEMNSNMKRFTAFHKIGRREAFTPSVVTAAVDGWLDTSTGCWGKFALRLAGAKRQRPGWKRSNSCCRGTRLEQHCFPKCTPKFCMNLSR
ncbi:FAD binding domain-containing protein [Paenibacillus protaetiae]|nr:FAD binding domain-containing protein [Paenibacillus protaetiae]